MVGTVLVLPVVSLHAETGPEVATFDKEGPDGTLYRAEQIHTIHLASLHKEFCSVVSTESLL